jgi:hypothetical protein
MSPEQCQGLMLDRRSDIFAIGTLLHELSTGKTLFNGSSDFEVMKRIVEDPIRPPSTEVPGYPSELDRIVLKALGRDPVRRYTSAREMQLDIERFALEHKLAVSTARLASFMEVQFADRIAAWRERASLEHAARAAVARPPSAEIEIVDVAPTTRKETPSLPPKSHRRSGFVVSALAGIGLLVVAQRQLASSRSASAIAAAATPASAQPAPAPAPASTTAQPVAALPPSAVAPKESARAAGDSYPRFQLAPPMAEARLAAASPPAVVRRHRSTHRHGSTSKALTRRAAAKSAPTHKPKAATQANWNPEDGLPPGTNR